MSEQVVLSGACTLNGLRYARSQLVPLFGPIRWSDYGSSAVGASLLFHSAQAAAQETTKVQTFRAYGGQALEYSRFFPMVRDAWRSSRRTTVGAEELRVLADADAQWKFLHEVTPTNMYSSFPTVELSKWARRNDAIVVVRVAHTDRGHVAQVMVIHEGYPLVMVEDATSGIMHKMNLLRFQRNRMHWDAPLSLMVLHLKFTGTMQVRIAGNAFRVMDRDMVAFPVYALRGVGPTMLGDQLPTTPMPTKVAEEVAVPVGDMRFFGMRKRQIRI